MIRLKYSQFMSFPFTQSMQKLANQSFPARTAYAMKKLGDDLQKQRNQISKEYLELVDGYATKNADGSLLRDKNDPGSFDIAPEKMEAYQAAEKDFGEREFVLDRPQIALSDLAKCEFTPAELTQLDPLICGEPDASTGTVAPVIPMGNKPIQHAEGPTGVA